MALGLLANDQDDPRQQGLLALGLGLLGSRGSFAESLSGAGQRGMVAYNAAMQQQRDKVLRDLQVQAAQAQLQEQQRQQGRRQRMDDFVQGLPSPQTVAAQSALAGGGGPTVENAARMPAVDPIQQMLFGQMQASGDPSAYMQSLQPKAADYKVVGDALVQVGPGGVKEAYKAPQKPAALPAAVQEYEYAKEQGYGGTFEQWDTARKQAGATNVRVDTGQKGLDNTLKLRGDFRSEPVYKAHQEMQSAYSQIQQSLKQASPAGDLAGATKLMKLLDPGSVVRESELGMAMAASGLMDRAQHYATNILNGTKLTPTQRTDFQALADALYSESVKQYNGKRKEYEGIATRNGLSVPDVLGSESAAPGANGGWSITPKGK